jgi:hypothetical protein
MTEWRAHTKFDPGTDWVKISEYPKREIFHKWSDWPLRELQWNLWQRQKTPSLYRSNFFHMSPRRGHNYVTNKSGHTLGFAFCLSGGRYITHISLQPTSNAISTTTPETIRLTLKWLGLFGSINVTSFTLCCQVWSNNARKFSPSLNVNLDWSH